jgi:hypothetical protein
MREVTTHKAVLPFSPIYWDKVRFYLPIKKECEDIIISPNTVTVRVLPLKLYERNGI